MTILPLRMAWLPILIRQLQWDNSIVDLDFRETVGHKVWGDPIQIRAQIFYQKQDYKDRSYTGDQEPTAGHLVIKQSDLLDAGIELHKGDRIVGVMTIAGTFKNVDYEIVELLDKGHLPASLTLHVHFVERTEMRSSN